MCSHKAQNCLAEEDKQKLGKNRMEKKNNPGINLYMQKAENQISTPNTNEKSVISVLI